MNRTAKKKEYKEVLQGLFLFQGLGSEAVSQVYTSSGCECVEFEPGEMVYTQTSFCKALGVVLTGELRATRQGGGMEILLNVFSSGMVFGAAGLFAEEASYVSDIQAIKRSRVFFIPEAVLSELFQQFPMAAEQYIRYLSGRIRFLNRRIDSFAGGNAEKRVAAFLLDLAAEMGKQTFRLPVTYTDLAETLNIGRASLYRALEILQEDGSISRCGRDITLKNEIQLRKR